METYKMKGKKPVSTYFYYHMNHGWVLVMEPKNLSKAFDLMITEYQAQHLASNGVPQMHQDHINHLSTNVIYYID